jgi:hypothetical protein
MVSRDRLTTPNTGTLEAEFAKVEISYGTDCVRRQNSATRRHDRELCAPLRCAGAFTSAGRRSTQSAPCSKTNADRVLRKFETLKVSLRNPP